MKHKRYAVEYSVNMHYEAVLMAQNGTMAVKKVVEVIGEPVDIHSVCELKRKDKNEMSI